MHSTAHVLLLCQEEDGGEELSIALATILYWPPGLLEILKQLFWIPLPGKIVSPFLVLTFTVPLQMVN